jgi:predicted alpha/beta hydrolase family esterase
MKTIFIIHGTGGNPQGNWFPWLKNKLEKLNFQVFVPEFPTLENQSLENWMKVFKDYINYIDNDTIFIGHSLGPAFILNILKKINIQIKACFFVSGFIGLLNNNFFDSLNKTFMKKNFDWEKIKNNCKKFYVINSDNDPYVSFEKGKELAEKLNTELIIIKDAGHINSESGYTEFEFLLGKIISEIEK